MDSVSRLLLAYVGFVEAVEVSLSVELELICEMSVSAVGVRDGPAGRLRQRFKLLKLRSWYCQLATIAG